jgi:hypothetical protein|tara:strand:- start:1552 stop:1689 length:138 start_codon:yes stop_codon:yes gene_type:complete
MFEKQPLLRVHGRRLSWRDTEAYIVEQIRSSNETTVAKAACNELV